MGTRLRGLLRKELIQFFRDRVMPVLILWLCTVEVMVCTYALSFDVRNVPLAVVDLDRSPTSRALVQRFLANEAFAPTGFSSTLEDGSAWLQTDRPQALLVIPPAFARDLQRGAAPAVQVLLDGTNVNIAASAQGYAHEIVARFAATEAKTPGAAMVRPVLRVRYNPQQSSTPHMVLSMIALAALMVGVFQAAASIVREKETGTVEQLMVTPIRTGELFLAKTVPTLAMGLLAVFPSLLITRASDVPLRGSLALFLVLTALFQLSAVSLGVLIAAVTRMLQQALLLSFFGLFPIMFLSGTVAPVESMPEALQRLSLLSPLRHYMDVILGIFLKGVGLAELWPQALALLGSGLVLFAGAALIFQRRLG
jgi:ABC-2 type transport system permease protein